jgi:hypothetical protein
MNNALDEVDKVLDCHWIEYKWEKVLKEKFGLGEMTDSQFFKFYDLFLSCVEHSNEWQGFLPNRTVIESGFISLNEFGVDGARIKRVGKEILNDYLSWLAKCRNFTKIALIKATLDHRLFFDYLVINALDKLCIRTDYLLTGSQKPPYSSPLIEERAMKTIGLIMEEIDD